MRTLKIRYVLILFVTLISCGKYNSEIFEAEYLQIYGEWNLYEMCGGWNGSCSEFEKTKLEITEFGHFFFINDDDQNVKGNIEIIEQNESTLEIRFEPKKHDFYFLFQDNLAVIFEGGDTMIFHEGCCDRNSYKLIRSK